MDAQYQKKSYTLFRVWLAAFVAVMLFFVFHTEFFPPVSAGKNAGILALVFLDLLFLMVLTTQSIYWISGITYEEAARASADERRRYALLILVIFLAVTVIFLVYCFGMKGILKPDYTRDSLVAGGAVCLAAVTSSRVRLQAAGEQQAGSRALDGIDAHHTDGE